MEDSPVIPLAEALEEYSALVRGVHDDQWATSTPCPEWTVRDLVNHITGGNLLVISLLDGAERPDADEMARRRTVDFLGADPAASFGASADGLVQALSSPEALERPISMPIGTVPGAAVAGLRLTETVVHGWDLATATEQAIPFSEEAVDGALTFTRRALATLPPGNRAFGPAVAKPDGAAPLQELVSLLGRDCSWTPRPA